eukprot:2785029-Pleurochrysis_carterae.AAC.11
MRSHTQAPVHALEHADVHGRTHTRARARARTPRACVHPPPRAPDAGELFNYIVEKGRLEESEAARLFAQAPNPRLRQGRVQMRSRPGRALEMPCSPMMSVDTLPAPCWKRCHCVSCWLVKRGRGIISFQFASSAKVDVHETGRSCRTE